MESENVNMHDIRNILDIKTLRWKIEKLTLERIGHVLRMSNKRTKKAAILGWLASLEELPKLPGHKKQTLFYWRKLLKEAGINWAEPPKLATDRKKWIAIVVSRVEHIHEWETERAKHHQTRQKTNIHKRNLTPPPPSLTCEVCNKQCKTRAGLTIHRKRMHRPTEISFSCEN